MYITDTFGFVIEKVCSSESYFQYFLFAGTYKLLSVIAGGLQGGWGLHMYSIYTEWHLHVTNIIELFIFLANCVDPGTPKNGYRAVSSADGGFADGTVVYFYCNAHYKLSGAKKIVCTKGKWSGKKPFCQSQGMWYVLLTWIYNDLHFKVIFQYCTSKLCTYIN